MFISTFEFLICNIIFSFLCFWKSCFHILLFLFSNLQYLMHIFYFIVMFLRCLHNLFKDNYILLYDFHFLDWEFSHLLHLWRVSQGGLILNVINCPQFFSFNTLSVPCSLSVVSCSFFFWACYYIIWNNDNFGLSLSDL